MEYHKLEDIENCEKYSSYQNHSRKVSECDMVVFNDNKEILSSIDAVKKVCWCLDLTFAKLTAGSVIEKYTQG